MHVRKSAMRPFLTVLTTLFSQARTFVITYQTMAYNTKQMRSTGNRCKRSRVNGLFVVVLLVPAIQSFSVKKTNTHRPTTTHAAFPPDSRIPDLPTRESITKIDELNLESKYATFRPTKHSQQEPKQAQPKNSSKAWSTALLSLSLALTIWAFPFHPPGQVANAGFGPSGGATTSPVPGVTKVNVGDLSGKKLTQIVDNTLDGNRLDDIQSQLDALIESIVKTLNTNTERKEEEQQEQERLQRRQMLPSQQQQKETEEGEQQLEPPQVKDKELPQVVGQRSILSQDDEEQENRRLESAERLRSQILNREKLLEKLEAQPWWFNYLAAFCGSIASTLVMHPVDTIKTRLQSSNKDDNDDDNEGSGENQNSDQFSNLYQGLTGNMWKEGPPSALYLGVYESVKAALLRPNPSMMAFWTGAMGVVSGSSATPINTFPSPNLLSIYLVAGAAGELVGSTVRAPAEAVKSLVQTQQASTASEAFGRVLGRPEGRQNVFRAWSSSLWRDVPFGAIQLAVFETTKAYILNNPDIDFDSSTLASEAIIGAFAGGIGSFVTNPFDVITTRIITQQTSATETDDETDLDVFEEVTQPLGFLEMTKLIYTEGGLGAFFAGWEARVIYWAPAISLFLTCYCTVRQMGVQFDLFGS